MRKIIVVLPAIMLTIIISLSVHSKPVNNVTVQKVIIIRHGEKPGKGDNLSCQGFNRSLQLPAVLFQQAGIPGNIYVPSLNLGKSTHIARMYQTILPFAIKYNLDINTKYDVDDVKGLAESIKTQQGVVVVVWEHGRIGKLVNALGLAEKEKWSDDDFDSIWIVSYKNGIASLTKSKEGLHPSNTCP